MWPFLSQERSAPLLSRRWQNFLTTFIVAGVSLTFLFWMVFPATTRPSAFYPISRVPDEFCNELKTVPQKSAPIPNIVHYVWLLRDPTQLQLDFRAFVTMYSSYLYFQPEKIYIHTDATSEVFEKAKTAGEIWTRRVLAIPGITPNYVVAPNVTSKGVPIKLMEHQADSLRIAALREFGGIYLDMDAIPLRDIGSLRNSGFANVVGGAFALTTKHSGYVNNGVMMAKPHSNLMEIYYRAADQFFDGSWATASVLLLTDLANRLSSIPSEVLILQPTAFAPMSWEDEDKKRLFQPHFKTPATTGLLGDNGPRELKGTCLDAMAWLKERESEGKVEKWEMDFSSSYILHAFDDELEKIWGWDHKINLEYVLARQSNYARAVYPAIWHAIQAGVIEEE
ncbi:hypothetical protein BGZ60DRAFT_411155 [Tricladium varicosporioides]|nr:hypothetical protein BGZ60DRAFT_411155 [Hymenoscyphus varicosporioides]